MMRYHVSLCTAAVLAALVGLAPATAQADDRLVNGALGAGAGAIVAGPIGLVAGGIIGAVAGKDIARELGLKPRRVKRHRRVHRRVHRSRLHGRRR